jgi:hypothetical protein
MEGAIITTGEFTSKLTIGLLGAEVDRAQLDIIGPKYFTDCRLEEIERRILNAEENIRVIAALVQP